MNPRVYTILMMLGLAGTIFPSGLSNSAVVFAGEPGEAVDPLVSGPAPKGLPSEPGWGFYAAYPKAWQAMHQSLVDRAKGGNIDLIFLLQGDHGPVAFGNIQIRSVAPATGAAKQ
jgi:hypothetical protein